MAGKMSMRFDGKTPMVGLDTCQKRIAIGRLTMRADPKTARESTVTHGRARKPRTYNAILPPVLCSTQLPVTCPANAAPGAITKPQHSARVLGQKTAGMDFSKEDRVDAQRFNRLLWQGFKGEATPYPEFRSRQEPAGDRQTLFWDSEPR